MFLYIYVFIIIASVTGPLSLWITNVITYVLYFKYLLFYFSHQQLMITDDVFINFVSLSTCAQATIYFLKPLTCSVSLLVRNQLTNTFIFISQKIHFSRKKIHYSCQALLLIMISLSLMDQFLIANTVKSRLLIAGDIHSHPRPFE